MNQNNKNKTKIINNLSILSSYKHLFKRQPDYIIAQDDIAKNYLLIAIIIMVFLCSFALAALSLLNSSVERWNKQISNEATIEIMPLKGHDIDKDLKFASELALNFAGVYDTDILSENSTKNLLKPWLGTNFDFKELPVPRVIILHINNDSKFDENKFANLLKQNLPNSYYNNHNNWAQQLKDMANKARLFVAMVIILLFFSLIITIIFATKTVVMNNKHIIEVLHFLGGSKNYIANQFDVIFFHKAWQGSLIGCAISLILFLLLFIYNLYHPYNLELSGFFNDFKLGLGYYLKLLILIIATIIITIFTSRKNILYLLEQFENE